MQNLVSRIAGINNEEMANRGIGLGAAMGYTVKSIAYQVKENENQQKTDIISGVINKANNTESVKVGGESYENNSKNAMDEPMSKSVTKDFSTENNNVTTPINEQNEDTNTINEVKKAYNVGKEFMNLGMYMAEGRNFKTNGQEQSQRRIYNRPNINNTRKEDKTEDENKVTTVEVDDADEY